MYMSKNARKKILKKLGDNLVSIRDNLGLSQEALGQMIGIPSPMISRYENGNGNPTILTLYRFAKICSVSVCDLVQDIELV